jgi:hypothetical protein
VGGEPPPGIHSIGDPEEEPVAGPQVGPDHGDLSVWAEMVDAIPDEATPAVPTNEPTDGVPRVPVVRL